jgi:hypothetical protein
MDIIVTRHAKKRLKKRIHKNIEKAARCAYDNGIKHSELKGSLKRYVDKVVLTSIGEHPTSSITDYKIYNDSIYLFAKEKLVTVFHIPNRYRDLCCKLTKQKNT